MSTTQITIQNNSTSRAFIQLFHKNDATGTQSGGWYADAGATVGPLTVSFQEKLNNMDWWAACALLLDGPSAGRHATKGAGIGSGNWTACNLRTADAGKTLVFTLDAQGLGIQMSSGRATASLQPMPTYVPSPGASPRPITNVFVLMLENHSFDNMFAMCGIPGVEVATTTNFNANPVDGGTQYFVQRGAPTSMPTDPGHEFTDVVQQLTGLAPDSYPPPPQPGQPGGPYPPIDNSGFAANYATTTTEGPNPAPAEVGDIMACLGPDQIPNLSYLAQNYVICDHWFSSMPGPTWPNRFFLHGGTSGGLDHSPTTAELAGWETIDGFSYPQTALNPKGESIFDRLNAKQIPWRLYNDKSGPVSGAIAQVSAIKGISIARVHDLSDLATDLQSPYPSAYTFIEPNYGDISTYEKGSSQHPMDDVSGGDRLVATVFNAIAQSPLWPSSLLIITYDEHGGFYDHVAPPQAADPQAGNQSDLNKSGFDWTQYGVRVPALIVSPLLVPQVDSTVYDHTSVLATLSDLFGTGALTNRDAEATSLLPLIWNPQAAATPPGDVNQPPPVLPINPATVPTQTAAITPERRAQIAQQPLPPDGNLCGFLGAVMKADHELSGSTAAGGQAILDNVQNMNTKGDVQAYAEDVMARVSAQRAAATGR